jgi:hypothetical protein
VVREGLAMHLATQPDLEVCGEVAGGGLDLVPETVAAVLLDGLVEDGLHGFATLIRQGAEGGVGGLTDADVAHISYI